MVFHPTLRLLLITFLSIIISYSQFPFIDSSVDDDPIEKAVLTPLNDYVNPGGVRSVSLSSDGRYLAAGGKGFISYFHTERSDAIWSFHRDDLVDSLSMSPDGGYIVVGMEHAEIYYFSNESGEPLLNFGTDGPSLCTDISDDGRFFTMGTFFGALYLMDGRRGSPEWVYESENVNSILSTAISGNARCVAAGTSNSEVLVFGSKTPRVTSTFIADGYIHSVDLSYDGRYLAAGSNGSTVYLYNTESGELLWNYKTGGSVRSVCITRDGEYIVAGSYDGGIYFFTRESSFPLWVHRTNGLVKDVEISQSKDYVVAGGTDRKLRVLRVKDGGLEASHNASSWIISVSPSYNGNTIAYSEGRRVKVLKLTESIRKVKVNVDSQEKSIDHFTILIFATAIVVASILVVTFIMFRDRGWVRRSGTRGG